MAGPGSALAAASFPDVRLDRPVVGALGRTPAANQGQPVRAYVPGRARSSGGHRADDAHAEAGARAAVRSAAPIFRRRYQLDGDPFAGGFRPASRSGLRGIRALLADQLAALGLAALDRSPC